MSRRTFLIYGLLGAAWLLLLGWLAAEHYRVRNAARTSLVDRAKYVSTALGIVLRSQRHFGGVITKERLESALGELVRPGELNGIALLNEAGDVVVSSGTPIHPQPKRGTRPPEVWGDQTVTLVNLIALGTNVTSDLERTNPPIVLSRDELFRPFDTNRPPGPDPNFRPPPPPPDEAAGTNAPGSTGRGRRRGPPDGRPRFARPFWMSEEEYKSVLQKQGVHSFVIVMSTRPLREVCQRDLWLRSIIGLFASISVIGSALAWRNVTQTSDLQIRLVRASEMNTHLKEMNLAAAGLAHETRNPLNIIRGLAQMVSKQEEASSETRKRSLEIVGEVDRVTAQLNQFINYSRPREVRRVPVALGTAVGEVVRALGADLEEKGVRLQIQTGPLTIDADEQLLRQALFNLLLNAIQAVGAGGQILVCAQKSGSAEATLEVRDDGPGVPPERRTDIFKPYFTTNQNGTGLGLAVVQQIVLAHGWDIECLPNQPRGAIFRISRLKAAAPQA